MADPILSACSDTIADRLHSGLRLAPNECIEWTRALNPGGYGRISRGVRGRGNVVTHRLSWEIANGPIPEGMCVLHSCDNPPCCNPEHLFLGTLGDNTRDMFNKGRARGQLRSGEQHKDARLTDRQVAELRHLAPAVGNYAALGRMYGITKQHARALCLGHRRAS